MLKATGIRKLFQQGLVPEQYVLFGDLFSNSRRLEHGSTTQDEDLIGVKDRITILIEYYEFIAVFLFYLFAELAYACLLSLFGQFVLLVHPGLKCCGQGHGHEG